MFKLFLTILNSISYLSLDSELIISKKPSPKTNPLDEKFSKIILDSLEYIPSSLLSDIFPLTKPS